MPLLAQSTYTKAPYYQYNGHMQTLIPGLFRSVKGINYTRERLELPDDDFVDLDWVTKSSKQLIILTHGLEGDSERQYIRGAAKFFTQKGWDALAWNCRSCSGELNRQIRLYSHGEIADLEAVIHHAIQKNKYEQVVLCGYSMGGSITLKYLGVHADNLPKQISHGVAFSSPCDLRESVRALEAFSNTFYKKLFRNRLERKIRAKALLFPDKINIDNFKKIKSWTDFDHYYSAPLNGYKDADDFYYQASAKNFMQNIKIPSLLVNANNDPIIPATCSPVELCKQQEYVHLERPDVGGHVGFAISGDEFSWMDYRTWEFIQSN